MHRIFPSRHKQEGTECESLTRCLVGTMNSLAPSGVGRKRVGVSISKNPLESNSCLTIVAAFDRFAKFLCNAGVLRSRYLCKVNPFFQEIFEKCGDLFFSLTSSSGCLPTKLIGKYLALFSIVLHS